MKTTFQAQYPEKTLEKGLMTKAQINQLKQEHFVLGTDNPTMSSTNVQFFTKKANGKQDLNEEKMSDLRSSHFELGKEQACYSLTSNLSRNLKPQTAAPNMKAYVTEGTIRNTHFTLGNEGSDWKTSYNKTHLSPPSQVFFEKSDSHKHLSSSLKFGSVKIPISNSQASFQPIIQKKQEKPDTNLMKQLRSSHFSLGNGKNSFQTTSSQFGAVTGEPSKIDKNIIKDLRSSHFKYGSDPIQLLSTNNKDFTYQKPEPTTLNIDLAKNLRKTHFKIGQDKDAWLTENQNKYLWIQPKPDKDFKILLT